MSDISDQIKSNIVNALSGQNSTECYLSDIYEISIEDIEQIMIDEGYERCEVCDYWFEASETLGENDEPLYSCKQCRGQCNVD